MMDETSFKFFVDQVLRQYQDLKADIRSEMAELKKQLAIDNDRTVNRLEKLEKRTGDLEQFRWYMAGAAAAAFSLAEVMIRVVEYYFKHKG